MALLNSPEAITQEAEQSAAESAPPERLRSSQNAGPDPVPGAQEQFLSVVSAEEAWRTFCALVRPQPLGLEQVPLAQAWGRVLACDVCAPGNVPPFDRSHVDGYAIHAEDSYGAEETSPCRLRLIPEALTPGRAPHEALPRGYAMALSTGSMLPRGADAVLMVEDTHPLRQGKGTQSRPGEGEGIAVLKPVTPGEGVGYAGADIGAGETVLRRGCVLSARDTGVLAALGLDRVAVWRRPRVALLSSGDELVPPGQSLRPGQIHDANATLLADAVREAGGEVVHLGIVADAPEVITAALRKALHYDFVLLSGGTSKGAGDLTPQALAALGGPGICVHGVAIRPGKPLCLGAVGRTPVAILPGFPSSAMFTFRAFVAPLLRILAGLPEIAPESVSAELPLRIESARGRTEYLFVSLVPSAAGWVAYPVGKDSGSVTNFVHADGFITIENLEEYLPARSHARVQLLSSHFVPAELIVLGSHCLGLDALLNLLSEEGLRVKALNVGSQAGLNAALRGECDVAGCHLLDEASGIYNAPFLSPQLLLEKAYRRKQGIVFRADTPLGQELMRLPGSRGGEVLREPHALAAVRCALKHPALRMANRNRGSGTRILIEELLQGLRPEGYAAELRSHNAVAAAVLHGRADWGVAIAQVAQQAEIGFYPLADEEYDWVLPRARLERRGVQAFLKLARSSAGRQRLHSLGFRPWEPGAA